MGPTITKPWPGTLAAGLKRGLSAGFLARASLWRCAKRAASARRSVSVGGGEVVFIRQRKRSGLENTAPAAGIASVQNRSLLKPSHMGNASVWAERHRRACGLLGFRHESRIVTRQRVPGARARSCSTDWTTPVKGLMNPSIVRPIIVVAVRESRDSLHFWTSASSSLLI